MATVTNVHEAPNGNLRVSLDPPGVCWVPNDPNHPHYRRTVQPWLDAGGTIQPLPPLSQGDPVEPEDPNAVDNTIPTADSIRGWDGLVVTLIEAGLLMRSQLKQETVDVINRQRALDDSPPL